MFKIYFFLLSCFLLAGPATKACEIYDLGGQLLGQVTDPGVYDRSGMLLDEFRNSGIYNNSGMLLGQFRGSIVYDYSGSRPLAVLRNPGIYSADGTRSVGQGLNCTDDELAAGAFVFFLQ